MNRKLTLILALLVLALISVSIATAVDDVQDDVSAYDDSDDAISQDADSYKVSKDKDDEKIGADDKPVVGVIEFPVKIVWEDNDNDARKRPSSVIVIVNAGENTREIELTDLNDWKGSAKNIPDADKDSISVQDVKVDGYTTKITGNSTDGYEITCTYKGDSKDNSTDPTDDNKKKDSTDDKDSKKETTIIKKTTTTTTKEVPVKKEAKEVKNESKKDPNKEKLKHDTGNPVLLGVLAVALVGLAYALYRRE